MGNTINNVGIAGVPKILINAESGIAPDSLSHTERCDPTPKQFITEMNKTYNFSKTWGQMGEGFLECIGCTT